MQARLQRTKKWLPVAVIAMLAFVPINAFATTPSGTLAVTATVTSSITMTFASDTGSGVPLSGGSGTNAATLAFGNISLYGTLSPNVTRTVGANNFTVSTPVLVAVSAANAGTTSTFTLTAQLLAADPSGNTWAVGGTTINSSTSTTITTGGTLGSAGNPEAIAITVLNSTAPTSISNTINFTATAP